jgi:hypothetical protein
MGVRGQHVSHQILSKLQWLLMLHLVRFISFVHALHVILMR